jgi:hypothetical protein
MNWAFFPLLLLFSGCAETRFSHRCASGETVELVSQSDLITREIGSLKIKDSCGGAELAQTKTDQVQALEAGIKAAAGLAGKAIAP